MRRCHILAAATPLKAVAAMELLEDAGAVAVATVRAVAVALLVGHGCVARFLSLCLRGCSLPRLVSPLLADWVQETEAAGRLVAGLSLIRLLFQAQRVGALWLRFRRRGES